MKLSFIINSLVSSYLRNLAISDLTITKNKNDIISYIDLALTEINESFFLNYSEHIIDLIPNQTLYKMPTNCSRIFQVFDEGGNELELNGKSIDGVYTPNNNTILYSKPYEGGQISVLYLSSFDILPKDNDEYEIEISQGYLSLLLDYCCYLAHVSQNPSATENSADNNIYYVRYVTKKREKIAEGVGYDLSDYSKERFFNGGYA
jgi:hypothetical protein